MQPSKITPVYIYRWDDAFGDWDHEASFHLLRHADIAIKALQADRPQDLYRLVDTGPRWNRGEPVTYYYRDGKLADEIDTIGKEA